MTTRLADTTEEDTTSDTRVQVEAGLTRRQYWSWFSAYLLVQSGFLLVLRRLSPRFFYIDDLQAQYLPVFHWFGRHLSGGRPPLISPELGAAGNFVADPQYGALDPAHWLMSWLVGQFSNLYAAAWLLGAGAVLILGLGVVALLLAYRCPPPIAVAAAVGVSSTGMVLWIGSSWWPLLWTTAWLPWLWYGLAARGRHAVVCVGISAWLLAAGGYPYNLLFAAVTVAAQLAERWISGGPKALASRECLTRTGAGLGGALIAIPGLLSAAQMVPYATRGVPTTALGNEGSFIVNLADILLGQSTLTPNVAFWGGPLVLAPIAATTVFAVPALALVSWRRTAFRPGVVTAAVMVGAALVATQLLPTHAGPFRFPWRYLANFQLYLPILAALGLTYGFVVNKARLAVAVALVVLQFALASGRAPLQLPWHVVALVIGVLAIGSLAVHRQATRGPIVVLAGAALVVTSVAGGVLSERAATALNARDVATFGPFGRPPIGEPARNIPVRTSWGYTVEQYREQLLLSSDDPTVLMWDPAFAQSVDGWESGILAGNANLIADVEPGFGYTASGHQAWSERGCVLRLGELVPTDDCVEPLLDEVPGYPGSSWVDLMSSNEVLLSLGAPPAIQEHFLGQGWRQDGQLGEFQRYVRAEALPGRVTATSGGVTVRQASDEDIRPGYGGQPLGTYLVSTQQEDAELVLRIPYWPGMTATVAGEAVDVHGLEGTLTVVELPRGLSDAPVRIEFRPVGEPLLWPSIAAGSALILLSVWASSRSTRRGRVRV